MTLKEQAGQSGLALLEKREEWNETDWPPLEGGWRCGHATVVLDHTDKNYNHKHKGQTVVVMGGFQQRRGYVNSVLVLNLADPNKQWREGPTMNKNRAANAGVVCNGGIYVVGGVYTFSFLDCVERIDTNDVVQSSLTNSTAHESQWTTLTCRLSTRRYGCCAVVVHNRYIVVMGGWNSQRLSAVDIIDTSNHTIIAGPNMNVPRSHCSSVVVGHRIFIVGGSTANTSVEYLDFGTPSDNKERNGTLSTFISSLSGWITHSDLALSDPREICGVVTVGSCLVVAGGSRQNVEVLDTHRNRVWDLPPLQGKRMKCFNIVTVANQVAVIGGWHNPSCATLEIMDKNTWCFQRLCEQHPYGCHYSLEGMGTRDADSNFLSSSVLKSE